MIPNNKNTRKPKTHFPQTDRRKTKSMAGNKKELNGYFSVVATKVSPTDKEKLRVIAKAFNLSFYELLQALLLAMVRYFDTDSEFDRYESNVLLNGIGNILESIDGSFSPLSMNGFSEQRAKSAIIFLERKPEQRPQPLMVSKNTNDEIIGNYNFDAMLTAFLEAADPEVLQKLKEKEQEYGYFSMMHTLHELVIGRTDNKDEKRAEIQKMFTDVRIGTGQQINSEVHYQRKHTNRFGEHTTTIWKEDCMRADI